MLVLIKGGLSKNNSYKHVRRGTDKLVWNAFFFQTELKIISETYDIDLYITNQSLL